MVNSGHEKPQENEMSGFNHAGIGKTASCGFEIAKKTAVFCVFDTENRREKSYHFPENRKFSSQKNGNFEKSWLDDFYFLF